MAREVEQGGLQQVMQMMVEMRAADEKAARIREERRERKIEKGKSGGLRGKKGADVVRKRAGKAKGDKGTETRRQKR